ncbi:MAG: hypothetical protein ISP68_01720 [Flavobacteriaceae bacterium]|nr:hypothetical protein [Flavobacteriaceae bacterium]
MKTRLILLFSLLLVFTSCKEDDNGGGTIVIPGPDPGETVFIAAQPNLNDGAIEFEVTGPSFDADDAEDATRTNGGTWSRFGGNDEDGHLEIEYADNPAKDDVNGSDRVLKITEPEGIFEWAGFYFTLSEAINFPDGKEAIKMDYYSNAAGTKVAIKLEDELANGTEGKVATSDIYAETEGTGWETLVFNLPEGKDTDGVYNTLVIMPTRADGGVANTAYLDNIDFATPKEVVAAVDPTDAPAAPSYAAAEVISLFSDAYEDVAGTDFNTDWGSNSGAETVTIADNTVLKYANLGFQGTQLSAALDVSSKTKLHVDFFTGNASDLDLYLISTVDGNEVAYSFDVETTPGEWNSVDISLDHFTTGDNPVDLTKVDQLKLVGNGTVYLDNIFFYGGGSQTGTDYNATFEPFEGSGATYDAETNVYEFPTGAQAWAGFANTDASIYPLAFVNGGKVTFTAATAGVDIVVNFRFEKNPYPDVDPAFSTANVTVSGTTATEYTVEIPPRPAEETYSSALFYLVTQDQALTASDFVITSYD